MKSPKAFAIITICLNLFGLHHVRAGLDEEERAIAAALYKTFVTQKQDLVARTTTVNEMVEMGGEVAKVIYPIIDREFRAALARYESGFATQAKNVGRNRDSRDARNRIKELRQNVQALRSVKDLSKGQIVKIGDPALVELRKLTSVTRQEILDSSPEVGKARADLLELGKQRAACIEELLLVDVKDFDPKKLTASEEEIAASALNEDRDARKILDMNKKLADEIEPHEADAIRDLNELRMLVGLRPCVIDPKLCDASRGHSKDMKEHKFFAHESPLPGKKSPWDRAKLAGTNGNSENIYVGSKDGKSANRGWWHSPGHHKNMLAPGARRVGMGSEGGHWTQMFGG